MTAWLPVLVTLAGVVLVTLLFFWERRAVMEYIVFGAGVLILLALVIMTVAGRARSPQVALLSAQKPPATDTQTNTSIEPTGTLPVPTPPVSTAPPTARELTPLPSRSATATSVPNATREPTVAATDTHEPATATPLLATETLRPILVATPTAEALTATLPLPSATIPLSPTLPAPSSTTVRTARLPPSATAAPTATLPAPSATAAPTSTVPVVTPTPIVAPTIPTPTFTVLTPVETIVTASNAFVYDVPSTNNSIIGGVQRDDRVVVLGSNGTWYLIRMSSTSSPRSRIEGGQGWIARDAISPPSQSVPVITP